MRRVADGPEVEHARAVAALWRRIRWGTVVFCVVQFAVYQPTPGAVPVLPLLPVGTGLALLMAGVNLAATAVERSVPRAARAHGRPGRRDLVLLVADSALVAAVVLLFAPDPGAVVWVLLIVPLLEAGLLGGLRWALWTWGVCLLVLLAREAVAAHAAVVPLASTTSVLVTVLGYRAGVLLLVATIVGTQASVTARYVRLLDQARRQLAHEASHDHLTGLAGRALFLRRARRALEAPGRGVVGVVYVDCDRFKDVNDTHGHAAGDAVLVDVAGRLRAGVRPTDTVARLGGDEFAVLLEQVDAEEAERIAARLREALARPYPVDGGSTTAMTCSVGLALDRGDGLSVLLRRADLAMYRGKGARALRTAP